MRTPNRSCASFLKHSFQTLTCSLAAGVLNRVSHLPSSLSGLWKGVVIRIGMVVRIFSYLPRFQMLNWTFSAVSRRWLQPSYEVFFAVVFSF